METVPVGGEVVRVVHHAYVEGHLPAAVGVLHGHRVHPGGHVRERVALLERAAVDAIDIVAHTLCRYHHRVVVSERAVDKLEAP